VTYNAQEMFHSVRTQLQMVSCFLQTNPVTLRKSVTC